jgi:chromosome segregation ATPase
MQVKMLTALGGSPDFPHGSLQEIAEHTALAWIKAGICVEAPAAESAAQKLETLAAALAESEQARDGHEASATDLKGKLVAAKKEAEGARAEAKVHRDAFAALKTDLAALREDHAAAVADRDTFRDQATHAGEQLAEALAALARARDLAAAHDDLSIAHAALVDKHAAMTAERDAALIAAAAKPPAP